MQFLKVTVKLRISQESVWINNSIYLTSAVVQGNNGFSLNDSDYNLWASEADCPQHILKLLTHIIHLGEYSKTLKLVYMFYGCCWLTGNSRDIKKNIFSDGIQCLFFSLKIHLCKSEELEKLITVKCQVFTFCHRPRPLEEWEFQL